tara:strand:+ start:785 stop:1594 length:810 start_codon:yes stop_codon:yes gene_type:complete
MKPLVDTEWLSNNIKSVRIIDATWHLPNSKRVAIDEYKKKHIEGSVYFDIDLNSDKTSSLPHMMPKKNQWHEIISNFGIHNNDHIIIYDNSDVYSSCRLWFSFIYFGHDPNLVSVLDGGFLKWIFEKRQTVSKMKKFSKTNYLVNERRDLIVDKIIIDENIASPKFDLIDARSEERFLGKVKEPREGLKSGSIPKSINLHYKKCLNKDNTFKNVDELKKIFSSLNLQNNLVFTCGSGITATIIGLVYSIIYDKRPVIYDGSWSEYGLKK